MPLRKWTQTDSTHQFAHQVADRLSCHIAGNRAPWQKCWDNPPGADLPPFNPRSRERFRGLNAIQLRSAAEQKGYNDPRWMSYRAAECMSGQVHAGEKGTTVEYLAYSTPPDPNVKLSKLSGLDVSHKTYTVFNAEQINVLPPLENHLPRKPQEWETCERAERLLRNSGAQIETHNKCFSIYENKRDTIVMPNVESFRSPRHYYSQAVQELSSWTGNKQRLDRQCYHERHVCLEENARETMRVHIACMTVNSEVRLPYSTMGTSFHKAWRQAITRNPDELRSAASDADRISKYLLQYDRQPDRNLSVDQIPREARVPDMSR